MKDFLTSIGFELLTHQMQGMTIMNKKDGQMEVWFISALETNKLIVAQDGVKLSTFNNVNEEDIKAALSKFNL